MTNTEMNLVNMLPKSEVAIDTMNEVGALFSRAWYMNEGEVAPYLLFKYGNTPYGTFAVAKITKVWTAKFKGNVVRAVTVKGFAFYEKSGRIEDYEATFAVSKDDTVEIEEYELTK